MENFENIFGGILLTMMVLAILMFGLVFLCTIITDLNGGIHEKIVKTKCYDRYGSEIENLKCKETKYCATNHWTIYPKCSRLK